MFDHRIFPASYEETSRLSESGKTDLKKLTDCSKGEKLKITDIYAGFGAAANLASMGLRKGNIIELAKVSRLKGPVTIFYQDTEIAIGHRLAERIVVEVI